MSLKIATFVVL
ncbi:Protein of unknown function [Bacillus wiedmannii]|nr:Protein of unknown function [Bacillus wiedmannii]